jgi:hypothetical protein
MGRSGKKFVNFFKKVFGAWSKEKIFFIATLSREKNPICQFT